MRTEDEVYNIEYIFLQRIGLYFRDKPICRSMVEAICMFYIVSIHAISNYKPLVIGDDQVIKRWHMLYVYSIFMINVCAISLQRKC